MTRDPLLSSKKNSNDDVFEESLRPNRFYSFIGQQKLVNNLKVFIEAAKKRNESLDHVLLSGPPGLGKTTLSRVIANEMDSEIKSTSGPILDKPGDLAGLLTNLSGQDVLFIDEIHRLNSAVEEYLYGAMEDFKLDIMIDSGPSARTVQLAIPPFTLIGATTRVGLLTSPLRARFGVSARLDYYDVNLLEVIVIRSSKVLGIKITQEASNEIARRSRGTPRISNKLLRRARDFAQVQGSNTISLEIARKTLEALEIDEYGLDDMDKRIIGSIIEKYHGGPVGLSTIAISVGEHQDTIEEVYEPFLIQEGYLVRTPRGRSVTNLAYKRLGLEHKNKNIDSPRLF